MCRPAPAFTKSLLESTCNKPFPSLSATTNTLVESVEDGATEAFSDEIFIELADPSPLVIFLVVASTPLLLFGTINTSLY